MFSFFETSRDQGRPVELYLFKWGTAGTAYYAYTNAERAIIVGGVSYNPISIDRSNISVSGTIDKQDLNITLPHTSELSELARLYPPGDVIAVTISQGHADDSDAEFKVIWRGRVISVARKDTQATARCQGYMTSLKRQGLKRCYMYGCPHSLYGTQCRADKGAATISATVSLVDAGLYSLNVPPGWHGGTSSFNWAGGTVEYTGSDGNAYMHTIKSISGTGDVTISTASPLLALVAGQNVNLVWGCDHTMNGCNLHGNILNYGGQPWMPFKDPTGLFTNSTY